MADISISAAGPSTYEVTVADGRRTTTHRATVPGDLLERWGLTRADEERVVRESFVFLLEREPATSIMMEFSLSVISRYFPEYEEELPRRLGRG